MQRHDSNDPCRVIAPDERIAGKPVIYVQPRRALTTDTQQCAVVTDGSLDICMMKNFFNKAWRYTALRRPNFAMVRMYHRTLPYVCLGKMRDQRLFFEADSDLCHKYFQTIGYFIFRLLFCI
jgi:hypothetical protein